MNCNNQNLHVIATGSKDKYLKLWNLDGLLNQEDFDSNDQSNSRSNQANALVKSMSNITMTHSN